ncbi:MAG: succinyl-diaminopimelate desuccinylase [Pseudomonadota bacterium]
MPIDPVELTADLVRCPSVTPDEGGALVLLTTLLSEAGFECWRVDRGDVANLYARWGDRAHPRSFGFNGHTDVVPVGDMAAWTRPPFGGVIEGDWLYGRGATDMKSGVAAFAAAAVDFVTDAPPDGAVILAITGDEEGPSINGTPAILDWMETRGEVMNMCLVGEPTCPETLGDMIKIGRRGSLSARFTFSGKQGHSAYLDKALNPMPAVAMLAHRLSTHPLDSGSQHFDPSTIAVTTIDTGNPATNVIPAETRMVANIRFNDHHTGEKLTYWLLDEVKTVTTATQVEIEMQVQVSGEPFLTPLGALSSLVSQAIEDETGTKPEFSTSGGTSDARYMRAHCPVVEFGLVGHRMHEIDERVSVSDIRGLKRIYRRILRDYFD